LECPIGIAMLVGMEREWSNKDVGIRVSPLVTYLLGALTGQGHLFTAVAAAIVMTMLLTWTTELSRFAGGHVGFVIYPTLPIGISIPGSCSIRVTHGSASSPLLVLD
jgi:uncharacterized membrane protein (DUF4010 family)